METCNPPGFYVDPPAFDIELEEFGTLPMRRLEAVRLLREGQTMPAQVSEASPAQKALTADARLLLLHGHGDRPSEAKNQRADLASHFILKLACCGGKGGEVQPGTEASKRDDSSSRREEVDRRSSRREWFVRAERDLFEARLHWHLQQNEGEGSKEGIAGQCSGGTSSTDLGARASIADRLEALRMFYDLEWLQPVGPAAPDYIRMEKQRESGHERSYTSDGGCTSSSGGRGCGGGGGSGIGGSSAGRRRRDGENPFREHTSSSSGACLSGDASHVTLERQLPPSSKRKKLPQSFAVKGGSDIGYLSCPFEKVLPLVRSRQVLLRDGKALLSPDQLPEAVVQHFEGRLREGIAIAERGLPEVEADDRVAEVLGQVRRAVDSLVSGGGRRGLDEDSRSMAIITRKNIDQLAEKHFPLCMRRTLRILRREHHLKYQARLQLISFLGNAGMEVDEILGLWREEFPKGMPADEYARKRNQYEYSLRHLCGLEGKRKAYRPQSCARIASVGWGGSGEGGYGHGCPYHSRPKQAGGGGSGSGQSMAGGSNDTSLRGMLVAQSLPAADIEDIVAPLESCRGAGAVGACRRHFLATHRLAAAGGGGWRTEGEGAQEASPNGWLAASTRSNQHQPRQQQQQRQQPRQQQPVGKGEFLTQEGQGV
ncbi:unnamed protein product [Ectocarpus sp. 4 AP-2014]